VNHVLPPNHYPLKTIFLVPIKLRENLLLNNILLSKQSSISQENIASPKVSPRLPPTKINDLALLRLSKKNFLLPSDINNRQMDRKSNMRYQFSGDFSPRKKTNDDLKDNASKLISKENETLITDEKQPNKRSFYNVISDIYLCKKFTNVLLSLTALRKPKWLNPYHFKLINDKSFFYESFQQGTLSNENMISIKKNRTLRNVWENLSVGTSHLFNKKILIFWLKYKKRIFFFIQKHTNIYDPTKKFSIIWDLLLMVLIIYLFIIIPLELGFSEFLKDSLHSFKKYGLIFLLLDIAKSLNTSFYNKGILVTNRKDILIQYLHNNFPIDIIALLPLMIDYYLGSGQQFLKFLNMSFLFKYTHFKKIRERLEELVFFNENLISLMKLVFRILLFSHIFACLLYRNAHH